MSARLGWLRACRIGFALLTAVAIAYQFVLRAGMGAFDPVNFFSFFTIESNLVAATVLLLGGLRPDLEERGAWQLIRGAAVVYMTTTGIVYGLLLTGYTEALQTATPWVNTVLHRLIPLVAVADWLLLPPPDRIPLRRAALWVIYPLAYLAYSLVRGPLVGWYPYPFLDPRPPGGYGEVALYCLAIAAGFLLASWIVVTVGRRVRLRVEPSA